MSTIKSDKSTGLHSLIRDRNRLLSAIQRASPSEIREQNSFGQTLLHLVATKNYADIALKLIQLGAFVNVKDRNNWTPLHSAAHAFSLDVCRILLLNGANTSALTAQNTAPIHYLVRFKPRKNDYTVDDLLSLLGLYINVGGSVDATTAFKETPLHQACYSGLAETVEFLLKNGADANTANSTGETSLHFATRCGDVAKVRLLMKAGGNPSLAGAYGNCMQIACGSLKGDTLKEVTALFAAHLSVDGGKKKKKKKKKRKKKKERYGIACGVKRGKCESPCNCSHYRPLDDPDLGGPCKRCGHFPVKHLDMGRVEGDDSPDPDEILNVSSELAPQVKEILEDVTCLIDFSELEFGELLGKGTSAHVYKGTFRGQEVAIKVMLPIMDPVMLRNFRKELEIMRDLKSPNVAYFYGTTIHPKICMILEFLPNGSLYHILSRSDFDLSWSLVLKLLRSTAAGISTLHSWKPQILHRDLKSLNVLVDDSYSAKVCDFGLSRFTESDNASTLNKLRGTYAYCAPEVYLGKTYSTKSDVYSFGVMVWEVVQRCLSGEYARPYGEFAHLKFDFQVIIQTAKKNLRPTMHSHTPSSLVALIERCWDKNPEVRPEISEVVSALAEIQSLYTENSAEWDALRTLPLNAGSDDDEELDADMDDISDVASSENIMTDADSDSPGEASGTKISTPSPSNLTPQTLHPQKKKDRAKARLLASQTKSSPSLNTAVKKKYPPQHNEV